MSKENVRKLKIVIKIAKQYAATDDEDVSTIGGKEEVERAVGMEYLWPWLTLYVAAYTLERSGLDSGVLLANSL